MMANSGKADGDTHRIFQFNKNNPNLIRISEPVQSVRQSVFTKKPNFQVNGWESLGPYKVIYVAGIKSAEKGVRIAVSEENRIPVDTIETAFKMLARDRGELLITSPETGFATMKCLSLENSGIRILEPPVEVLYLYSYLHKKHAALVDKIARSLKEMKRDGTYQRIIEDIKARHE
jgi:polar amino acid transport system substrate-binding protein